MILRYEKIMRSIVYCPLDRCADLHTLELHEGDVLQIQFETEKGALYTEIKASTKAGQPFIVGTEKKPLILR